MTMVSAQHKKV